MFINTHMSNLTSNYNFLSPTGFKLVVNHDRLANLEYFATSVTLPSFNTGVVDLNSQQHKGYIQGDMTMDELSLRVAIDEDMKVYTEMFEWMIESRDEKLSSFDATLIIMTSHNNPNRSVQFKNIFPVSMGSLEFNTQSSDIEYLQADISFRYDEFKFV